MPELYNLNSDNLLVWLSCLRRLNYNNVAEESQSLLHYNNPVYSVEAAKKYSNEIGIFDLSIHLVSNKKAITYQ
jgi:hypothetical protein